MVSSLLRFNVGAHESVFNSWLLSGFGAVFMNVVSVTLFKVLGKVMPAEYIIGIRSFFTLILLSFFVKSWKDFIKMDPTELFYVLVRSMAGVGAIILLIKSMSVLPLYTVVSFFYTAPVFSVLLGAVILKSPLKRNHYVAMFLAVVGCLIFVFGNGTLVYEISVVMALGAALLFGLSLVVTKKIEKTPSTSIQLIYNVMACGVMLFTLDHTLMVDVLSLTIIITLVIAAFLNVGMNWCYIKAYREGQVAVLSILEYLSIPLGMLFGYLLWQEVPSWFGLLSTLFIVSAGIVVCYPLLKKKTES